MVDNWGVGVHIYIYIYMWLLIPMLGHPQGCFCTIVILQTAGYSEQGLFMAQCSKHVAASISSVPQPADARMLFVLISFVVLEMSTVGERQVTLELRPTTRLACAVYLHTTKASQRGFAQMLLSPITTFKANMTELFAWSADVCRSSRPHKPSTQKPNSALCTLTAPRAGSSQTCDA